MSIWWVKTRKKFDRLSLAWLTSILRLLSRIVPYRIGVWAGGVLGFGAYYLLPRERKRAVAHLFSVFREKGYAWIRRTARQSFVHLGKALLEIMLINPGRLQRVVEFRNQEIFQNALAQGRGVIFVTGHMGNWELMGSAIASLFPISAVAAPIEPEEVNDTLVSLRDRMGYKTILRGRPGAARELIRVFKENRILALLIDQDTDVEGAFVNFLGRPAWTPTAPASMAIRFGAPVVFGYCRREKNGRHSVIVEGPLELIRTGDDEKDIVANTAMLTKKIEDRILQNPEQWVWMHRRWRRQP